MIELLEIMKARSKELYIRAVEIDSGSVKSVNNMPVSKNGSLNAEDEYALRSERSSRIEREYGLNEKRYVRMFSGSNRRYIKKSF